MPHLDISRDAIPGYTLGGAVVRRAYNAAGQRIAAGSVLSADAFMAIGYAVRRLFVREGQITPFYLPRHAGPGTCHIIHRGGGRYDVVRGVMLNDEALTREDAETLAATPFVTSG